MYVLPLIEGAVATGAGDEVRVPGAPGGSSQNPSATSVTDLVGTAPNATIQIQGRADQNGQWATLATHTYAGSTGAQAVIIPLMPFLRANITALSGVGATASVWVVVYEER